MTKFLMAFLTVALLSISALADGGIVYLDGGIVYLDGGIVYRTICALTGGIVY